MWPNAVPGPGAGLKPCPLPPAAQALSSGEVSQDESAALSSGEGDESAALSSGEGDESATLSSSEEEGSTSGEELEDEAAAVALSREELYAAALPELDAEGKRQLARQALAELAPKALDTPRVRSNPERVAAAVAAAEAALAAAPPRPPQQQPNGGGEAAAPAEPPPLREPPERCACDCGEECAPRKRKVHSSRREADPEEYLRVGVPPAF